MDMGEEVSVEAERFRQILYVEEDLLDADDAHAFRPVASMSAVYAGRGRSSGAGARQKTRTRRGASLARTVFRAQRLGRKAL